MFALVSKSMGANGGGGGHVCMDKTTPDSLLKNKILKRRTALGTKPFPSLRHVIIVTRVLCLTSHL